jgi:hypothetical protein
LFDNFLLRAHPDESIFVGEGGSVKKEKVTIGKILFCYFGAIPFWIFCVGYFVFTFPRRLRFRRQYREAPKQIKFQLLSDRRTTLGTMSGLIDLLRAQEEQNTFPERSSVFDMLEALWEEEMSTDWKIPSLSELESAREVLCQNILLSPFAYFPHNEILVWAIDDHRKMFIGYCPFTGKSTFATPDHLLRSVMRGKAPNSQEKHFAYAVSVTPQVSLQ